LADKSGLIEPERTLVLADASIRSRLVESPAVARFVTQVTRRSEGRLRVDLHSRWIGHGDELMAVHDVAAGRADLGWAEVHTLDAAGVASLRPLLLPLLIDSYPIQRAVLQRYSAELTADLQAKTGVTAVALLAGRLRFPASTDHPIVTNIDWAGRAFWTSAPGRQQAGIEALGARPVVDDTDRQTLTQAGIIDSAEATWRTYPGLGYRYLLPFVAPNVHLWPRVVALFANPAVIHSLSAQQRGWLRDAAADAATWAAKHAGDADVVGLRNACHSGAKASLATPGELTAMRASAQELYEDQSHQHWITRLLRDVELLRRKPSFEPPIAIPRGCDFTPTDARTRTVGHRPALTGPGPTGALPRGRYRYSLTEAAIVRAGKGLAVGDIVQDNAGVWTWTIGNGTWSLDVKPSDTTLPIYPCSGWIAVSGDIATFTRTVNGQLGGDCVPSVWSARFTVQGSTVEWSDTDVTDYGWVFQTKQWQRIR
jgi:TRAP-type C4-dicarboxylate transport system substrate-binding protein